MLHPFWRIGLLLAYAILAMGASGRSFVQLTTRASEAPLPYTLSAVAAVLYGVIALALWRGWRRVAIVGTVVELAGVLVVGTLGTLAPDAWPDETVWTGFGSGYVWIPLALPVLALWALLRARKNAGDSA